MRDRLIELLKEKSVRTGEFVLASGQRSDLYVDVRQTSLHSEGSWLIGNLLLDALHPDVVAVGGLTMGADPLATAVSAVSWSRERPIHAFLIRKEPKGHGTKKYLEGTGNLAKGDKVAILEDTTTTGGSLLKAVWRAREWGLDVVQALTIVERQEGAAARIAEAGLDLQAITTREDLLP